VEALLQEFRYEFTPDNPFVVSATPFNDALQLYKDGDLSVSSSFSYSSCLSDLLITFVSFFFCS
jgi:hypothetical protein